jgi:Phosphotransferase enzyme family
MTGSGGSASAYPLPLTAEGITAAWLSAGLRTRYPGVVITQVEPVQIIDGIATKVRLRLAYGPRTRRDGLPDQMCVKGGFGAYREYLGGMGFYSGEVRFFNEIAPLYELARPASYFGLTQSDPVQGIVALEDLQARGVAFGRATRPLSVELARAGLDALAALHGQSWGDGRPRRLGVEPLLSDTTEPILRDFFAALPERFAAPRGFAAPVALHEPDRLRAGFAAYRAGAQRGALCVVHGDAHIGNAYIEPNGRVGFVDWQTVAVGPWVHDVNYFLVSALDVPDRRAHERDLLGHYLNALEVRCVRPRTGRGVQRLPPGDGLRLPGLAVQPGSLAAGRREHRDVRTLRHRDGRSRHLRRPGGVMPPAHQLRASVERVGTVPGS